MKNIIQLFKDLLNPPKEKTVLVIDDSEVDRTFAARVLAKRYYVLSASGAKEGIEMALKQKPDLILLDYMMPEMNGPEVCRILKQDPGMSETPIVFFTGMDTPRAVIDGLQEGAEAYLIKPIGARDLLQEVHLRMQPMVFTGKDS
jgi:two-component system, cell cycle response regulator